VSRTAAILLGLVAVVTALVLATRLGRHPGAASSVQIDAIFAPWNRPDSPGCSVGVGHDGLTVHERGYGMASLELGVPISPASVFEAASISKQFTAMSVMLLVQRGRLSLDDDVRMYLPELPDYGSPLTIRHLLDHTSGLRDVFLLLELSGVGHDEGDLNEALLRLLARQHSLNYAPGTESQYNNGGYVLAATLVKRLSGEPLAAFARANIFAPLGMTSTSFQHDPATIIPNRASNYTRDSGPWRAVPSGAQPRALGNSGMWTTAGDLLRWAKNLDDVQVGSEPLLADMQKRAGHAGGTGIWGLGFEIGDHNGATFVGHGGGDRGIDNFLAWYPRQRLAIAVLCNADGIGSKQLMLRIADLYIPPPSTTPATAGSGDAPPSVGLPAEQLQRNAGLYRETGGHTFVRTFVRDGQLRGALGTGTGDSFPLVHVSETRFMIPATSYTFEFAPSASGSAKQLRTFDGQKQTGVFARVEPFTPSSAQLRAYAGVYASSELDVEWTLVADDATLKIRRSKRADTAVQPLDVDMFTTIGDSMTFSRNSRGEVTGFTLVSTGVRSLPFARVDR
jgi:CubicO group peptidase (beta-lactamase class C family)